MRQRLYALFDDIDRLFMIGDPSRCAEHFRYPVALSRGGDSPWRLVLDEADYRQVFATIGLLLRQRGMVSYRTEVESFRARGDGADAICRETARDVEDRIVWTALNRYLVSRFDLDLKVTAIEAIEVEPEFAEALLGALPPSITLN